MRVERASNVLECDATDLVCEQSRSCVQWLQSRVFHLVASEHLLNEQERIGSDVDLPFVMRPGPLERRQQCSVLGDVVRRSIRTPYPAGPGLPRAPPSM